MFVDSIVPSEQKISIFDDTVVGGGCLSRTDRTIYERAVIIKLSLSASGKASMSNGK